MKSLIPIAIGKGFNVGKEKVYLDVEKETGRRANSPTGNPEGVPALLGVAQPMKTN